MRIYITKVEKSDFNEFMQKAMPIITGERREKTLRIANESGRVTSAAAELLLNFAVEEQLMSGACAVPESEEERGVTLRPVMWRKLTSGSPGLAYTYTWSDMGKPIFAEQGAPFFSISHTANIAVVAISDAPVGIDIEGDRIVNEKVVRKAFCESDAKWILSGENEEIRKRRFLRCWTLKESYVKMRGDSVFSDNVPVILEDGDISGKLLEECSVVEETYERYSIAAVRKR